MANSLEGLPMTQLEEKQLGSQLTEKMILEDHELETAVEPPPAHGTFAKGPAIRRHSRLSASQIITEPLGIAHKRMGGVAIPPGLDVNVISRLWRSHQSGAQDVLFSLSPGLFTNIQVLGPLFGLAGDPLETEDEGKVDCACALRHRMLECNNPVTEKSRRCFYTILPPWLLPVRSLGDHHSVSSSAGGLGSQIDDGVMDMQFGKVVVLMTDPRYLILRQISFWEHIRGTHHGASIGVSALHAEEFLTAYLQEAACLGGDELQRLASWVIQEFKQPDKVRIVFVDDLIAEPEVAIRGLARFLGVPEQSELVQETVDELTAAKDVGLFYPRTDMLELQHFLTVCRDFEQEFARLPPGLQALWDDNLAVWSQLPNPRVAALGKRLQNHELTVEPLWWLQHCAGLCKPCSFAPRGTCREGDNCDHCHEPGHAGEYRRLSKKERLRKKKRILRAAHLQETLTEEES